MTKKKLIRIIKEEIKAVLREFDPGPRYQYREEPHVPQRLSDEEIEALRLAQTPEMKRMRALAALNKPGGGEFIDTADRQASYEKLKKYGDMNAFQKFIGGWQDPELHDLLQHYRDNDYGGMGHSDEGLHRIASDARSLDPDQMYDAAQIAAADRAAEEDYITNFSADKKYMNQGQGPTRAAAAQADKEARYAQRDSRMAKLVDAQIAKNKERIQPLIQRLEDLEAIVAQDSVRTYGGRRQDSYDGQVSKQEKEILDIKKTIERMLSYDFAEQQVIDKRMRKLRQKEIESR